MNDTKSKIIVVGLDNAGKSTLVNALQPPDVSSGIELSDI